MPIPMPWGGLTDLEGFNRRLAEWLIGYNTVLPHHSLGLKPPVRWLLENHPECQRFMDRYKGLRGCMILC